ncbi:hypothetical protein FNW02_36375 [Komarekiella sp. 'clone 1']|uniref:Uncharacterized protein n=1 Tax=Komarekiella delphini-convector SJRDD-AB1 TaxID=2593771 RepID=A0AA41BA94_9NOST|nr:hypothetical protein [Komarekiella delphini-convector]MBD6621057.1 hypothetical protein [Komarekiella delphini-convector SJRDD-AB1]
MVAKKVSIGSKPTSHTEQTNVDEWVVNRNETLELTPGVKSTPQPVKMKRLTLDISEQLHKAIKAKAVEEGVAMVDLLRELLQEKYGNTEKQK